MNITPDLCKQQQQYNGFAIADNYSLKTLLEYLGFTEELNIYELRRLRDILSSKKALRKLAAPCGYGKINTKLTHPLDYQQEVKLSSEEYYKFIGEKIPVDGKVYFDKSFPTEIKQQIYPDKLFELLVQNQNLGYGTPDKEEYDLLQKIRARK